MKKKLFLISFLLALSSVVKADYLEWLPFTITQPDGKALDCFLSGDEFYNWIHDDEGYTIIQAPDGYYYYADQDGDKLKPSVYRVNSIHPSKAGLKKWNKISKKAYEEVRNSVLLSNGGEEGPEYTPRSGIMNNLVVYIRFSDQTEFPTTRATYDNTFNSTQSSSLKSYYSEVSYNQLTINSTHYPACALTSNLSFQDTHPRSYFQPFNETTNPDGYSNNSQKTTREHQLLFDAITWINANSPVPSSLNIDSDSDGRVDNVCFIIRGNSDGWNNLLWAHRWALYSNTVAINGVRVYSYTLQPENQVGVKTLCHEMFHVLGAPDLYHYTNQGTLTPVRHWDLMESGSGHMGAYMKWKYTNRSWITSIPEITNPGTYTLNPLTSPTNNCYKIASPNSTNEYFIVEYRNKSGMFEGNLPGSGLIVYRIDTRYTGNSNGPPDEVYIYRQDGTTTVNGKPNDAFFSSLVSRTAINDATNPYSFLQDGTSGGLNIFNITAPGNTISFDVSFSPPCSLTAVPKTINVQQPSGTATFDISFTGCAGQAWSVTDDADWLTVTPGSGSGSQSLTVSYNENTSCTSRTATLTITAPGVTGSPKTVTVVQAANSSPVLSVSPSSRNVTPIAGSAVFSISNAGCGAMPWSVTDDADWLTVTPGIGSESQSLTASFDENTGSKTRTATITITAPGVIGSPKTVTVEQIFDVTSISDNQLTSAMDFKIYPNPANEKVYVHFSGGSVVGLRISVINLPGQQVLYQIMDANPTIIDLSGYRSGVYYIQLMGDSWSKTRKIVLR